MIDPFLPAWCVIRVLTGWEARVAKALMDQEIGAYSPHEDVRVMRYPRGRKLPGVLRDERVCLISGYVFVRCGIGDFNTIRDTDGVISLGGPFFVLQRELSPGDVKIVEQLMAVETLGAFDRREKPAVSYDAGELVRVNVSDKDLVAEVVQTESRTGRVRLLMDWLGSRREMVVPLDRVQPLCLAS